MAAAECSIQGWYLGVQAVVWVVFKVHVGLGQALALLGAQIVVAEGSRAPCELAAV